MSRSPSREGGTTTPPRHVLYEEEKADANASCDILQAQKARKALCEEVTQRTFLWSRLGRLEREGQTVFFFT